MNNPSCTKNMKPKIDILYLDMDGVLSDFMSRFKQLEGDWKRTPEGMQSSGWARFCEGGNFATLDTWPGWYALTSYVELLSAHQGFDIEILTSTGGAEFHEQVQADKTTWCRKHGLAYKVNAVPGRWNKHKFATPCSVLIDDTADVIEQWRAAGGFGILHTDLDQTILELNVLLDI